MSLTECLTTVAPHVHHVTAASSTDDEVFSSPGGRWIAIFSRNYYGDTVRVFEMPGGRQVTRIELLADAGSGARWVGDDRLLVETRPRPGDAIETGAYSIPDGACLGEVPVPLPSVTPDGRFGISDHQYIVGLAPMQVLVQVPRPEILGEDFRQYSMALRPDGALVGAAVICQPAEEDSRQLRVSTFDWQARRSVHSFTLDATPSLHALALAPDRATLSCGGLPAAGRSSKPHGNGRAAR
jgi:hypothetical protein